METRDYTPEEYQSSRSILQVLIVLLFLLPWFSMAVLAVVGEFLQAILTSFLVATFLLMIYSFFQERIERKYRRVSATQWDYFLNDLPLYSLGLVPSLIGVGYVYMIPRFGLWTIAYLDGIIVSLYFVFTKFPLGIGITRRATPITDIDLLSSFHRLAAKMGVENVQIFSVDWDKFKIANAFQVGPRKFSIYVSHYLLEKMTSLEIQAVMAHELAHAKKKHVAKSLAIFQFTILAALNLIVIGNLIRAPISEVLLLIGILSIGLITSLGLFIRRKFELEADTIAAKTLGDGRPVISALQKLADLSLLPESKGSSTHPSVRTRVQKIQQLMGTSTLLSPPPTQSIRFHVCPKCGALMEEEASFCSSCGTTLITHH